MWGAAVHSAAAADSGPLRALRLSANWCDVIRAALGRRRIGDSIVLEMYDFGPGVEPLLVATGLRGEEEEEEVNQNQEDWFSKEKVEQLAAPPATVSSSSSLLFFLN